jgi:DNA polymerase-3 subunit epsilon
VLALDAGGRAEQSFTSLLNPGIDPGPTHVHGLTAAMLAGQPQFADIVGDVIAVLKGRTLVAHNAAFDYAFLAAEAEIAGAELPFDTVMCTVELARRLDLGLDNLRLATLASHWGAAQTRPHDALDEAQVLARVLCVAAGAAGVPAQVAQRAGHPRRTAAAESPGIADAEPLPEPGPLRPGAPAGAGDAGGELGVPVVSDAQFMACVGAVVGGTGAKEFTDVTGGQQFALF